MSSPSLSAASPQDDRWLELAAKSIHPMSALVQDPITYRPPERLAHRQQGDNERFQSCPTERVHPPRSLRLSTPRSLSSHISSLCSIDSRFPPSSLHTQQQQEVLITILNPQYFHLEHTGDAGEPESPYGEVDDDGWRFDVASSGSDVDSPSASRSLRICVNTSCHAHFSGHDVHSTSPEAESPHTLTSLSPSPVSTPFASQLQGRYGLESEGGNMRTHWGEYDLDCPPWEDSSSGYLMPFITEQKNGVEPGPNHTFFGSSTQAPLSSPLHENHVPIQHMPTDTLKHIISEDKTLPESVLNQLFPPSSRRLTSSSSRRGTLCRMWTCQSPGCGKSVRRQERVAHALEHRGKKRFNCSCGGSFARSQDKKRHLREQRICANCTRPVGRNGTNGVCFMCIQLRAGGHPLIDGRWY